MYVLSGKEMRDVDAYTIKKVGIDARILMEYAGYNSALFITEKIKARERVAVFCGHGNNGGDGFVIARCLKNHGTEPVVFFIGSEEKMSSETAANYALLQKTGVPVHHLLEEEDLQKFADDYFAPQNGEFSAVVDALFGIGFQGKLPPFQQKIIEILNRAEALRFAIDIPSGVSADTGCFTAAFCADYTLTMAAPKYGHFLGRGREYSGEVVAVDIGIPEVSWQAIKPSGQMISEENISYPVRNPNYHKSDYGRVALIAGSPGFSGAAVLAAKAALHSGSGLITLYHQEGMETIYECHLIEVMTKVLPFATDCREEQTKDLDKITELCASEDLSALPEVKAFLSNLDLYDVLLIGPGLGISPLSTALINMITKEWQKPAVFDADALNILAHYPQWIKRLEKKPVVLTPHVGEFARMMQKSKEEVMCDTIGCLKQFLAEYDTSLLFKGITRIICNRDEMFFDISGNDGLATGGSGDVLSGILVSFLAQKLLPLKAAAAASYLLGKTAGKCAGFIKTPAITPSDIIDNLFSEEE